MSACAWQNPMKSIRPDIDRFKERTPSPFKTYQIKNRPMKFAWSGDQTKQPLLLVHGSPGSWEGWAQFLQNTELLKNFHIIAIDRPGYGGSGRGESELSLQRQANDIAQALQFNQSGLPAILVGHSFGGPVIAQIAVDYPTKVAALIFVASSVDPELEDIKWYQHVGTWWPFRVLIPTDLRVCNEEIYTLKSHLEILDKQLGHITVPVIIIHGDKDPLVPVENVDYLQRRLAPGLIKQTTIIPGMNHFIPWKEPGIITDAILKARAL